MQVVSEMECLAETEQLTGSMFMVGGKDIVSL